MAIAAMKVCHKRQRIPDDIKIVGYDDVFIASLVSPQITTVRQPIAAMAELSSEIDRRSGRWKIRSCGKLPARRIGRARYYMTKEPGITRALKLNAAVLPLLLDTSQCQAMHESTSAGMDRQ